MEFWGKICYNKPTEMYCIDGIGTLKDGKPTLIHESLNRVKNNMPKKLLVST